MLSSPLHFIYYSFIHTSAYTYTDIRSFFFICRAVKEKRITPEDPNRFLDMILKGPLCSTETNTLVIQIRFTNRLGNLDQFKS